MAHKIFINYRRDDRAASAVSIAQYLERAFCRKVFIDIDRIRPGEPFPEVLAEVLAASKVMLVIIGPSWLEIRDKTGKRRLDNPDDWVRLEIVRALARAGKSRLAGQPVGTNKRHRSSAMTVIPVLVEGARLPNESELPDDLKPLVKLQVAVIDHVTLRNDMAGLTRDIRSILGWPWGWPCWIKRSFAALILLAMILTVQQMIERDVLRWPAPALDAAAKPRCTNNGIEVNEGGRTTCVPRQDAFDALRVFKDCADVCPEMVVVPSGDFKMGSPSDEAERLDNEGPQHKVIISTPLAVGRYPITRAQFDTFVREENYDAGNECSIYRDDKWEMETGRNFRNPGFVQDDNHPVVCVNVNDVERYLIWLSKKTGKLYRLLSEAEREFATRARSTSPFWWPGKSITTALANYNGIYEYGAPATGEWRMRTVIAKSFTFNPWGLYQVHGNVYDWVADCWHDNYMNAPTDGTAWKDGSCNEQVVRGGSWFSRPRYLRSANRASRRPELRISDVGFRVARTPDP